MTRAGPLLLLVNPTSGRGRGARTAAAVAARLKASGIPTLLQPTRARGDAERLTREYTLDSRDRPRCVVACGGDGTVQEVAHALASLRETLGESCPALGLAPAGRCNDFARALGVPTDPGGITSVLIDGSERPVDLGTVNGRHFCTVLTMGADAEVSNFVDGMKLPLRGTSAYVYGAVRVLLRYHGMCPRIEGDFGIIERPLFVASIANTSYYGGRIRIAPHARADDGFLDLCLIDAVPRRRILRLLPRVLLGRHDRAPEVRFVRTRRLGLTTMEPVVLWADGERIATTPAEVIVAVRAIRVFLHLKHAE